MDCRIPVKRPAEYPLDSDGDDDSDVEPPPMKQGRETVSAATDNDDDDDAPMELASQTQQQQQEVQQLKDPLEEQIFTWTSWEKFGDSADMTFTGIKMKLKIHGFPADEEIDVVYWQPSISKVTFKFKDGTEQSFGLRVALTVE